jgi:hypothetical protein
MTYISRVHTVAELEGFRSDAKAAGLDDDDIARIVEHLAANPKAGVMVEAGVRKVRIARDGGGKRGGYRILTAYFDDDHPVYLLIVFAKNEKADVSKAEARAIAAKVRAIKATIAEKKRKST